VHGIIDRLDTNGDKTLITDYKLGLHDPGHAFQVSVYAWAAGRVTGAKSVSARVAYIGHDPVRVEDVTPDIGRIEGVVDAMEHSFNTGEFEAKPGEICKACVHRTVCEYAVP
jgi:hypothetical protein